MNDWQRKPKNLKKTWSTAILFATNPTWFAWGRHGGMPATNCLSYSTAVTKQLNSTLEEGTEEK
jgi:hypothetical protein